VRKFKNNFLENFLFFKDNKRITILEKSARTGDLLLDDAVVALHRSGYSVMDAINTMQVKGELN